MTKKFFKLNNVCFKLWDLERPLEGDVSLKFLKFEDDDEAKAVFWHSSAHILGESCERFCGSHLCYGPPITDGFYYDMFMDGSTIGMDDLPKLKKISEHIIKVYLFYWVILRFYLRKSNHLSVWK